MHVLPQPAVASGTSGPALFSPSLATLRCMGQLRMGELRVKGGVQVCCMLPIKYGYLYKLPIKYGFL